MGCKITQYKVEKGVFIEVNFTVYNNDVHGFSFIVININASKVMLNGTYCPSRSIIRTKTHYRVPQHIKISTCRVIIRSSYTF
ncbi:Uncharacterised protein [Salmonella enterica subsp. enterica serovar Typhi]|nr:Uncharacterised protein [Salmonella enterica subsp. enterica serovar Typhi]